MNLLANLRRKGLVGAAALGLAASLASFSIPASAAPYHGGYRGGYRGGWGWGPGAVLGGLAFGALAAGAASSYYYGGAPYYYGPGYYPGYCYPVRQRVWTGYGWAWRVVRTCY